MHRGWSIATINSRLGNRVFRVETVPARSAWCPAVSQAGALFALIVVSSAESTAGGMGTRMALAHHHQCNYCGYQLPLVCHSPPTHENLFYRAASFTLGMWSTLG